MICPCIKYSAPMMTTSRKASGEIFSLLSLPEETLISREYSFHRMCREVVIFGAEYFKYSHSYDLEA